MDTQILSLEDEGVRGMLEDYLLLLRSVPACSCDGPYSCATHAVEWMTLHRQLQEYTIARLHPVPGDTILVTIADTIVLNFREVERLQAELQQYFPDNPVKILQGLTICSSPCE